MAVVRNLLVRAGADFSALRKSMQQVQRDMERFKKNVDRTMRNVSTVLASVGVTLGLRAAIKDAMDFEAAMQQINRLMGDSADVFRRWVDEQAASFGMARSEAVRYGATYANLISTFSRSTAEVAKRTEELLRASAVIASSTGRTMEDVMERIRSGLLGNTEAIEDLGVNVQVAMLESTKAFRDFAGNRSWQQLDFQTQQTIRYFAILEQAAAKYGVELAQNTSSRQAAFVAQLKNAQLALGQAFLPIYNVILPALTRFATALANTMNTIAQFVAALFGYEQAKQQTEATVAQAGAVSDLGDAYEKAGKQAKRAVAGFDQLNLVGGQDAGATGGGAAGVTAPVVASGGPLAKVGETMNQVSQRAREMAEKVRRAFGGLAQFIKSNSDIIIAALAGVGAGILTGLLITKWGAITATVTKAVAAIRTAFVSLGTAIAGANWWIAAIVAAVAALVGAFVYFYRTNEQFRGFVDGILRAIGEAAEWLWQNIMVPFGQWLAEVMPKAWDAVSQAARWLWVNALVPFGEFLRELWQTVLVPVGRVLVDVLGKAFKFAADVAKMFWREVLVPLGGALSGLFKSAVEAVSAVLTFLWKNVFVPYGNYVKNTALPIMKKLIDAFKQFWKDVLEPLAGHLKNVFMVVLSNIFDGLSGMIQGFIKSLTGLMNFITGVFTGDWRKAWQGVKDIFAGIMSGLWAAIKTPLNMIIDGLNALIKGINKIKIDVPGWVEDLTGYSSFGFNIPLIPKLARGGLAYGPTLAMVGDNPGARIDPEVIAPLSKLESIMGGDNREIVARLDTLIQEIRKGGQVILQVGETEIARVVARGMNAYTRRTGKPLLEL